MNKKYFSRDEAKCPPNVGEESWEDPQDVENAANP
jgi:hypothetical protein